MATIDRAKLQANLIRLHNELRDADQAQSEEQRTIAEGIDRDRAVFARTMDDLQLAEADELGRHADAMAELRDARDTALREFNASLIDHSAKLREIGAVAPAGGLTRTTPLIASQAAE